MFEMTLIFGDAKTSKITLFTTSFQLQLQLNVAFVMGYNLTFISKMLTYLMCVLIIYAQSCIKYI